MVLTIIVVYLLVVLGIGIYAGKKTKSPEDYLVAGHSLGIVPMVGTYLATFFSALSMLGYVGLLYAVGIAGSWLPMTWATGAAIGPFLALRFRKIEFTSAPEFFKIRYGSKNLQAFAALMTIVGICFMLIVQFAAMGIVWSLATGRSFTEGLVIGAILAICYTAIGGFFAVAWTDVLQALVFVVVIIAGAVMIIGEVGGIAIIYQKAALVSTAPIIGGTLTTQGSLVSILGSYTVLILFFTFLVQGPGTGSHPQYLIRAQASKDIKTALQTINR